MRFWGVAVMVGVVMLDGCALLYNYSDYKDGETAGGGNGAGGMEVPCLVTQGCPPGSNECVVAVCDSGVCNLRNQAPNTPTSSQTVGDCKQNVCDGNGSIMSITDTTDFSDDGQECTDDVCNGDIPMNVARSMDTPCGATQAFTCDNVGHCVGCEANPTACMPSVPSIHDFCKMWTCIANECDASQVPDDTNCGAVCSSSYIKDDRCLDGLCQVTTHTSCPDGNLCFDANTCRSFCIFPDNNSCAPGFICNDSQLCQPCTTCAAWAVDPAVLETVSICPDSSSAQSDLKTCACVSNACITQCMNTALCDGMDPLTTECSSCLFANCSPQRQACQDTAVPQLPAPG